MHTAAAPSTGSQRGNRSNEPHKPEGHKTPNERIIKTAAIAAIAAIGVIGTAGAASAATTDANGVVTVSKGEIMAQSPA